MVVRRSRGGHQKQWSRGDRVLVYIRVSKVGNRQDTLISDDVQEDMCRKWAEREGLVIVGEPVSDLDKSGREITKRQIQHSIERVRRGEADGIVVWKVSRWGRNLIDSMLNVAALQDAGGFIASATENLDDIETPMGRFSLTQMLAIAQLQSDQIGETWRNIQDYRVGRGLPRSGKVRWGYVKNEIGRDDDPATAYSIHPVQGPWLRRAYEDFVHGYSLSSIVKMFRDNGVLSNEGNIMTYSSLRKIMDSGFAAGLLVDRRDVGHHAGGGPRTHNPNACTFINGVQPAIIDEDLWKAYVRRRAEKRAPREVTVAHRLAGLVRCGTCGRKVQAPWEKGNRPGRTTTDFAPYRQYKCMFTKHNPHTANPCPRPVTMRMSYVEEIVLDWLKMMSRGEQAYEAAVERQRQIEVAQADLDAIDKEISKRTRLRKRYLDMKVEAEDEDERVEMDLRRTELRSEIDELKARRAALDDHTEQVTIPDVQAFGAMVAVWEHSDVEAVNGMMRDVVQRIYVKRSSNGRGTRYGVERERVRIVPMWEVDPGPSDPIV